MDGVGRAQLETRLEIGGEVGQRADRGMQINRQALKNPVGEDGDVPKFASRRNRRRPVFVRSLFVTVVTILYVQ